MKITKVKVEESAGSMLMSTELECQLDALELLAVMRAVCPGKYTSPTPSQETCDVPRSNLEMGECKEAAKDDETVVEIVEARLARIHAERHLEAARGAVQILAEAVGIPSGPDCNVAKLAKQAHGKFQGMFDIQLKMDGELDNLRGAMTRFGMADVPQAEDGQELTKQCAAIAHHFDVMIRQGWGVSTERLQDDGKPKTRKQLNQELREVQQDAQRRMVDLATLDGYLDNDTPKADGMAQVIRWAAAMDENRKAETELLKGDDADRAPAS